MNDLSNKSILLFCPKFFGYEIAIKKGLEKLGANVIWFDDRPDNDFMSKALIRINKNFLSSKINNYYKDILAKLSGKKFDYLFFVNPEAISKSILTEFREKFPDAKCLLYMWDSFKNRKQNIELLPLFDNKFTFDYHDAEQLGINLRALFYIDTYTAKKVDTYKYDLLFVGTAHTDRYHFVKNITKDIAAEKKKLYFFLSSRALYYVNLFFVSSFKNVKYADISFKPLNHADIARYMTESRVVLDINHAKQTGLTIRTLETLGAGRKLITTNKEVAQYDFYDPANILIIDREKPVIDMAFLHDSGNPVPPELLFKYSLNGWLTEIFELA